MPSHSEATLDDKMGLLSVVVTLDELQEYEPVGALLEDIRMALHEGAGMAPAAVARGLAWARCWGRLDGRLKALYLGSMGGGAASAAIRRASEVAVWKIIEGGSEATGMTYAILRDQWMEKYGYPPPIEMIPVAEGTQQ